MIYGTKVLQVIWSLTFWNWPNLNTLAAIWEFLGLKDGVYYVSHGTRQDCIFMAHPARKIFQVCCSSRFHLYQHLMHLIPLLQNYTGKLE